MAVILKLIERFEVAKNTSVFMFEKPVGFTFKPGQYGGFTLINPRDADINGITRRFSLLSTPDDHHIAIAMRLQNSAYKRMFHALSIGSEIKFAGPVGTFTLHEEHTTPAVFIAGGIGITPFYSMIQDRVRQQSAQAIHLFYGNQTLQEAAFLKELMYLQHQHPPFKLVATIEHPQMEWSGETGFITQAMIKKYVPHLSTPIYYICGSSLMVGAFQKMLAEMGIHQDRIRIEDFPGY